MYSYIHCVWEMLERACLAAAHPSISYCYNFHFRPSCVVFYCGPGRFVSKYIAWIYSRLTRGFLVFLISILHDHILLTINYFTNTRPQPTSAMSFGFIHSSFQPTGLMTNDPTRWPPIYSGTLLLIYHKLAGRAVTQATHHRSLPFHSSQIIYHPLHNIKSPAHTVTIHPSWF